MKHGRLGMPEHSAGTQEARESHCCWRLFVHTQDCAVLFPVLPAQQKWHWPGIWAWDGLSRRLVTAHTCPLCCMSTQAFKRHTENGRSPFPRWRNWGTVSTLLSDDIRVQGPLWFGSKVPILNVYNSETVTTSPVHRCTEKVKITCPRSQRGSNPGHHLT